MNYDELVAALRRLSTAQDTDNSLDWVYGSQQAMHDAADAIEALQAEIKRQNAEWERVMETATEKEAELVTENRRLEAEVERLKGEKE